MDFDMNEYLNDYRSKNAASIEAGDVIDPANAEIGWSLQFVDLGNEQTDKSIRLYAARKPPDGAWIDFCDLEGPIQSLLYDRIESGLARAGLYLISVDDPTTRAELIALRLREHAARDALQQERTEAGKLIDPATAEMAWHFADAMDPYHDGFLDLPHASEGTCVGRARFARVPGGVWVNFGDLPDETCKALWARSESKQLMFPNGSLDPDAGWLKP